MGKLERFKEQVEQAPDDALLTAFLEQTENGKKDMDAYDAAKIVRAEILRRMGEKGDS